jgi:hypothetical protein
MVANVIKVHPHPEDRKKLADHHAVIFAGNNPRFDKAKFYKAAGVTEETVTEALHAYDVFHHRTGKLIETIFFTTPEDPAEVKRSLVDHDSYHPNITVKKARSRAAKTPTTTKGLTEIWSGADDEAEKAMDTWKHSPEGKAFIAAQNKAYHEKHFPEKKPASSAPAPQKLKEAEGSSPDAAKAREVADLKAARKKAKETKPYDPNTDQGDWKVHHRDEVDEGKKVPERRVGGIDDRRWDSGGDRREVPRLRGPDRRVSKAVGRRSDDECPDCGHRIHVDEALALPTSRMQSLLMAVNEVAKAHRPL